MSMDEQHAAAAGQPPDEPRASALMEISNAMVGLYKEQFGRGPTKARSHWCGPDAVACFLEETLTPAERNLVKLGEHQRLRDLRSFHSSIDTEVDGLAAETFIFYADGKEGPSRAELGTP
jgi:hypothetical protein